AILFPGNGGRINNGGAIRSPVTVGIVTHRRRKSPCPPPIGLLACFCPSAFLCCFGIGAPGRIDTMMKLTLVSDDGGVLLVRCEGQVGQRRFQADGTPLENLLGPDCYHRPVLLNLERTDWIDSSGISWLIVSHKRFLQCGGALVLHSLPPRV